MHFAFVNEHGQVDFAEAFTDWKRMYSVLYSYIKRADNPVTDCLVLLEQVSAMPGQGVSSMFTFGANYGGWIALLEGLRIPYVSVRPQKWQKYILGTFPKGESKIRAFEYVTKRYPERDLKKKDSGIIDAICMALYLKDNH